MWRAELQTGFHLLVLNSVFVVEFRQCFLGQYIYINITSLHSITWYRTATGNSSEHDITQRVRVGPIPVFCAIHRVYNADTYCPRF